MINLDEVKESEFLSEEGEFEFIVKDVEFGESMNGNPVHTFKCETVDGEKLNVPLYLTDKSLFRYKKFLKALGHSGEGSVDEEQVSKWCVGKRFIGVVKRKKPQVNIVTGETTESKFFEVVDFIKC